MIKLSDYVAKRLVDYNIKDVFMISGGGAMHLNNSIGKNDKLNYICNQHEQASSIAAEGYSRISGDIAVVCVTTGPGGTNAITGLIGEWLDSVPVLYISGQVKYETCIDSCKDIGLRQLGDQEINIIDIVKPITKYATMVKNPLDIKKIIDEAIFTAKNGRPGPVWIDIPLDIQAAMIDEDELNEFQISQITLGYDKNSVSDDIVHSIEMLRQSKRPVIIAGNGIRMSDAVKEFYEFIDKLNIPVLSSFNGCDLLETDNNLYAGRIGTIGNRHGNFALQNSDLILCLGSRNNIRQIGYNFGEFGKNAKKIIVDIDKKELMKPTIKPDLGINCDAKLFIREFMSKLRGIKLPNWEEWIKWCKVRKERYSKIPESYKTLKNSINPYYFMRALSEKLKENDIVVTGNGTASVCYFQDGIVKKNQRVIWNSGCAAMGYDLSAAIGASFANNKKSVICLAGDGSLQMNIQELETVMYYKLPIKIFLLNNYGYISIRQTHDNLFGGYHVACDPKSGVGMPDFIKIAEAYGLKTECIRNNEEFYKLNDILNCDGAVFCEVNLEHNYAFSPKVSSQKLPNGTIVSKPLEDMYPFLDRKEYEENIIKDNIK